MEAKGLINLICIIIAIVVFYHLNNVLGTRTGTERPPFDPYKPDPEPKAKESNQGQEVIALPHNQSSEQERYKVIDEIAPKESDLNRVLKNITQKDPDFDIVSFQNGARLAYEIILIAYAKGDKKTLEPLLDSDTYNDFCSAIDQREQAGEEVDFTFVGINKMEILAASLIDQEVSMVLRFKSEIISATYDAEKNLIDGNPQSLCNVEDCWTFSRIIGAKDPNWKLIATQEQ